MAYTDNVRNGVYIAPSGKEFEFLFDDVTREGGKKAAINELVEQNQADVQDIGNNTVFFPFNLYFVGDDYQTIADAFFNALGEKVTPQDPGILKHPRWGDVAVMPVTFSQKEGFVEDMRRAVFDVRFVTVSDVTYPTTDQQEAQDTQNDLDNFEDENAETFQNEINSKTLKSRQDLIADAREKYQNVIDNIKSVATKEKAIGDQFTAISNATQNEIDQIVDLPFEFAKNTIQLFRLPGKVATSYKEKIKGYKALADTLLGLMFASKNVTERNRAVTNENFLSGLFCGVTESVFNSDFLTRNDVSAAITDIINLYDSIIEELDSYQVAFEDFNNDFQYVPNTSTTNALQNFLQKSISYLLKRTFSLRAEKILTLEVERTPLDLCYELYGTINQFNFFCDTNNLTADEHFILPIGREVKYYV